MLRVEDSGFRVHTHRVPGEVIMSSEGRIGHILGCVRVMYGCKGRCRCICGFMYMPGFLSRELEYVVLYLHTFLAISIIAPEL